MIIDVAGERSELPRFRSNWPGSSNAVLAADARRSLIPRAMVTRDLARRW